MSFKPALIQGSLYWNELILLGFKAPLQRTNVTTDLEPIRAWVSKAGHIWKAKGCIIFSLHRGKGAFPISE